MSRQTNIIGLNDWARKLVHQTKEVKEVGERISKDGAIEPFARTVKVPIAQVENCGSFEGMFEEEYPLHKYTLPDGRVYQEFVQAEPWSSGPCIFLALKDKDGKEVPESLWSEEEINNA